jgi:hypothetical protein
MREMSRRTELNVVGMLPVSSLDSLQTLTTVYSTCSVRKVAKHVTLVLIKHFMSW